MKYSVVIFLLFFSVTSLASSLSFKNSFELKKVYLSRNILPSDLLNLYEPLSDKRVRMIAGKKSSWSDDLRQRLKGMQGSPAIKF